MIISVFPSGEQAAYCLPFPNLIRHIKTGTYKKAVSKARCFYQQLEGSAYREALRYIPKFTPAGHFKASARVRDLISFSQCIQLETCRLPEDILDASRRIIEKEPGTLSCFKNCQGDGLLFSVRTNIVLSQYHAAFDQLLDHYESRLSVRLQTANNHPFHYTFFSYDPLAFYNPQALIFSLTEYATSV